MQKQTRLHRVLKVSTDYAFCLHSKERVPYHIVLEVAYLDSKDQEMFDSSFGTEEEEKKYMSSSNLRKKSSENVKKYMT